MSETLKMCSRWLTRWLRKAPRSALPLGLSETEVEALRAVVSTPHWPHYLRALEALADSQLSELAGGLPHDRYLFTCGALFAIRRCYQFPDDVLTAVTSLKEINDVRSRATAERESRTRNTFLNTPWWDSYVHDAARAGTVPVR